MAAHVLVQDPSNLSSRFSNKDRLGYDSDTDIDVDDLDELIEENLAPSAEEDLRSKGQLLDFSFIERFLERIPAREADLIERYHRDKMKQEQIAKLFGITQAAVSYRLHRGIRRIQFLRTIPELEHEEFEKDLGHYFSDQDREILWRMYETTCQSEIAKLMNLTQGRVRHRFFRSLNKIKELIIEDARQKHIEVGLLKKSNKNVFEIKAAEEELHTVISNSTYGKYWTVFYAISDKHFNILHEVSLPQFQDRGVAMILPIE